MTGGKAYCQVEKGRKKSLPLNREEKAKNLGSGSMPVDQNHPRKSLRGGGHFVKREKGGASLELRTKTTIAIIISLPRMINTQRSQPWEGEGKN